MQTDEEVQKLKRKNTQLRILLIVVILLALLLLLIKGILAYQAAKEQEDVETEASIVVQTNSSTKTEADTLYVTFPGYGTTYIVNETRKSVPLINYDTNDVTVVYELVYKGNVILTTDPLAPGDALDANLYDYFKTPGEYIVDVLAHVKDQNGNAGSTANFVLTVILEGDNKQ